MSRIRLSSKGLQQSVVAGIAKFLSKSVAAWMGMGQIGESIASELAGWLVKDGGGAIDSLNLLVAAHTEAVLAHPEFARLPENDRQAVLLQVTDDLAIALDAQLISVEKYTEENILREVYRRAGHSNDGEIKLFSNAANAMYRTLMQGGVKAALVAAEGVKGWATNEARRVQERFDNAEKFAAERQTQIESLLKEFKVDIAQRWTVEAHAHTKILESIGLLRQSVDQLNSLENLANINFLERYLRAIRTQLDSMELFGLEIDPKTKAKEQRLSVAYITLGLKQSHKTEVDVSRSWPDTLAKMTPVSQCSLLVRGDAGMGKTTLLRWAAITASMANADRDFNTFGSLLTATEALTKWMTAISNNSGGPPERQSDTNKRNIDLAPKTIRDIGEVETTKRVRASDVVLTGDNTKGHWRSRIPFKVVLRDCKQGEFPKPSDFPPLLCKITDNPPPNLVIQLLEAGKALIMIDGLDEIPPGAGRTKIYKSIETLIRTYSPMGNLFIITTRPMEDEPAWIGELKFAVAEISPMSRTERNELVRRWHSAYASQLDNESDRAECMGKVKALCEAIDARPAIARVAQTPLLCAMICAISSVLDYKLPGSESEIIERLIHGLLWKRHEESGVDPGEGVWKELDYQRRKVIAANLAAHMVQENLSNLDPSTTDELLQQSLERAGRSSAKVKVEARIVRERLTTQGGIVHRAATGDIEFVHNTFKEFLAALVYGQGPGIAFLRQNAIRADCANVCRYIAAQGNRLFTEKLVRAILQPKDSVAARKLVAIRMVAAAPEIEGSLRQQVKRLERGLFPPKSQSARRAIADLGNEALEALRFKRDMTSKAAHLCVQALIALATPEAREELRSYIPIAKEHAIAALLADDVPPLEIPYFQELVSNRRHEYRHGNRAFLQKIDDAMLAKWLRSLSSKSALKSLQLEYTSVTDASMSNLASPSTSMDNLTELSVTQTNITDVGIRAIADKGSALKSLVKLVLDYTSITDEALSILSHKESVLQNLASLSLDHTRVTDAGVRALVKKEGALSRLTDLSLWSTDITHEGIQILVEQDSGLSRLRRLDLSGPKIDDSVLSMLSNENVSVKILEDLNLYETGITDDGIRILTRERTGMAALTRLSVWDQNSLTDRAMEFISQEKTGLKNLRRLSLWSVNITDRGLQVLARKNTGVKNLTSLELDGTNITDEGIKSLWDENTGLAKLKKLELNDSQVSAAAIQKLKELRPNLEIRV